MNVDEVLGEYPMSIYSREELINLQEKAIREKSGFCIRLYGRQYASFKETGEINLFEYEEISDDGTLDHPMNDKHVLYRFNFSKQTVRGKEECG